MDILKALVIVVIAYTSATMIMVQIKTKDCLVKDYLVFIKYYS